MLASFSFAFAWSSGGIHSTLLLFALRAAVISALVGILLVVRTGWCIVVICGGLGTKVTSMSVSDIMDSTVPALNRYVVDACSVVVIAVSSKSVYPACAARMFMSALFSVFAVWFSGSIQNALWLVPCAFSISLGVGILLVVRIGWSGSGALITSSCVVDMILSVVPPWSL